METSLTAIAGLLVVLIAILVLPFIVKKIEQQLEIFLFFIGLAAVSITLQWGGALVIDALTYPILITIAVLVAGVVFKYAQQPLSRFFTVAINRVGHRLFIFVIVVVLGLLSSIITAMIAALVLVEIANSLNLEKSEEVKLTVLACFAIGMGAVLTPIGEPLATITVGKLSGPPFFADFWFLFSHLWFYVIPTIIFIGILAAKVTQVRQTSSGNLRAPKEETMMEIGKRTIKVYLFVFALVFLGQGFEPLIDLYLSQVPYYGLYWVNLSSAILDNATLAAAELGTSMSIIQISSAILGLIIAGSMLIPGNIPNIIAANNLHIKSKEWAKFGVPLGGGIMLFFFFVILL